MKVASGIVTASQIPGKAARAVGDKVKKTLEQFQEDAESEEDYEL